MKSREDCTRHNLTKDGYLRLGTDTVAILYEIAISLGRIADMLVKMNGYIVEHERKDNGQAD